MTFISFSNYEVFIFVIMRISSIVISIVLSTLILFSSLSVTITYAYYELDPIGFIEKLCENKDKPELACNGKCHLKKVAENNTDNQQEPAKSTTLKEITYYVAKKLEYTLIKINKEEYQYFDYKNLYAFSSINKIDRPPQV